MESGAKKSVDAPAAEGMSALHLLLPYPQETLVLLEARADPCVLDGAGYPPVYRAVMAEDHHRTFLQRWTVDKSLAALEESIKYLVEHKADLNIQPKSGDGRTPLHWAVVRNRLKIVKVLLQRGACPNIQDDAGDTPLHYCTVQNNPAIRALLTSYGADDHIPNKAAETAHMLQQHNGMLCLQLGSCPVCSKAIDDRSTEATM
eukprot:GEMP01084397.1.p1 GENE.GEMP01084397.1~~GEMP01084397.1.p1  ORF type:complete len:203 (+),score=47.54 GEMP01084397.1:256-864(+)